jgi:hypothetical protein
MPPALRISPNPAPGRVRFAWNDAAPSRRRVEVYSVSGQRVASLDVPSTGSAIWNGLDRSGRRVPSGLYLAKVAGLEPKVPVKFMLLH